MTLVVTMNKILIALVARMALMSLGPLLKCPPLKTTLLWKRHTWLYMLHLHPRHRRNALGCHSDPNNGSIGRQNYTCKNPDFGTHHGKELCDHNRFHCIYDIPAVDIHLNTYCFRKHAVKIGPNRHLKYGLILILLFLKSALFSEIRFAKPHLRSLNSAGGPT